MAINKENIKLFESQRLTDEDNGGGRATGEDNGGGRATGEVVVDGQVNNLFRDIYRIDRTVGDVSMRKVFMGVETDNNDPYPVPMPFSLRLRKMSVSAWCCSIPTARIWLTN